jgi:transcription initiation factor TFIIB
MELEKELSRSGAIGFGEIVRIADVMKIPKDVTKEAFELFLKAKKKNSFFGKNTKVIANACLYIACRKHKMPWTIKDIAEESKVSAKNIRKESKTLLQKLEIKLPPADPSVFIDRFCFELDLSGKVKLKAKEILKRATKAKLTNKASPQGIAAAIVYIAAILSGEHRAQDKMSKIIDVTEVTIRNRYKEIAKELDIDTLL